MRKSGSFTVKTSPRIASQDHKDRGNDLFRNNEGQISSKQTSKAYDMIKK